MYQSKKKKEKKKEKKKTHKKTNKHKVNDYEVHASGRIGKYGT